MIDEETRQILRDILATQRAQIAISQRIIDDLMKTVDAYSADSELYRKGVAEWKEKSDVSGWVSAIRAITAAGVVVLLGYVIMFGTHAR
jgi:hypothetical protein